MTHPCPLLTSEPADGDPSTAQQPWTINHCDHRQLAHHNTLQPPRETSHLDKQLLARSTKIPPSSHLPQPRCRSSQSWPQYRPCFRGWLTDSSTARVRTLTGKEIELDIERDYKVRASPSPSPRPRHSFRGRSLTPVALIRSLRSRRRSRRRRAFHPSSSV